MLSLKKVLYTLSLTIVTTIAAASAPPKAPESIAIDGQSIIVGDWKLPADKFVPAKMPMRLVYPRPDSETASWARHRKAYPGLAYRIPIAVQGGAYPFRYEIVEGQPGMSVGETVWENDYGILSWTPTAEGGPYAVQVRVTDQQNTQLTASFNVSVTRNGFIFLDPKVASSGDGRINSPLKSFDDLHKNSREDRTFSGKILYLRGGQHQLTGSDDSNGNLRIAADNKPLVWLGYPGEDAVIDATQAAVNMVDTNSGHDAFFQGFAMKNSRPDMANSRFFFFGGGLGHRSTFFELHFENLVAGTAGNDNPGAIVRFSGNNPAQYFVVMNSSIQDYQAAMVGSIYATRYAVIDGNYLGPSALGTPPNGIFPKAQSFYWSIRRNVSTHNDFQMAPIFQLMGGTGAMLIEIAYNLVRTPSDGGAVAYNWQGARTGYIDTVWVYRNTILGRFRGLDSEYNAVFENNIVLHGADDSFPAPLQQVDVNFVIENNLSAARSAESLILDSSYSLKDEYRNTYLGTHGWEISP